MDTRVTTASIGNYRSKPAARVNLGIKSFPCLGRKSALGPKPDNYVSKPINDWLQHVTTQLSRLCICNSEQSKIVYPDHVSKFRGLMSTSLVAASNIANLPIFLTRLESKLVSVPFSMDCLPHTCKLVYNLVNYRYIYHKSCRVRPPPVISEFLNPLTLVISHPKPYQVMSQRSYRSGPHLVV